MISGAHKLAAPVIAELIEEARDAEVTRNIAMMLEALAPVWPDIDRTPDYAGFDTLTEARLLRLSGFVLSFVGKSRNRPEYHPRAKDLLSIAINLFGAAGAADEEAEANVILALAYWHAGEVEECELILSAVEQDLHTTPHHPVYLQACINRLMTLYYSERYDEAALIVGTIATPMLEATDLRLLAMYHNQAGLIYTKTGQIELAGWHLDKALAKARQAANHRFEGLFLNNRAVLELRSGDARSAMEHAENALDLFRSLGDRGWIPHVLDTKAQTLHKIGALRESLAAVDEAIDLFSRGADHAGLCESLWTRTQILLELGRGEDALQQYGRLHAIASANIGPTAAAKYTRALADELGLAIADAKISRLADLAAHDGRTTIEIFFVAAAVMSRFGINEDAAVPVRPVRKPAAGMPVIYAADGELHLAQLVLDSWASMFCVPHDPAFPSPLETVPVIGEVFGWCPISEVDGGNVEFREFPSLS